MNKISSRILRNFLSPMSKNFHRGLPEEFINQQNNSNTRPRRFPVASTRTIALCISYDGRFYSGVAPQKGKSTVGEHIESILEATGLGGKLTWAGRTDAGVSAVNMVASLKIGSRLSDPNKTYNITEADYNEYRYDMILNSHLPRSIRIVGWAPVPDDFNARFSCIQGCYRYYFNPAGLDLNRMKESVDKIYKMDNFYNLSKHSDKNARYNRTIDELEIVHEEGLCYLSVKARAFLHNMIRKIFWVVRHTGEGCAFSLDNVGLAPPDPLVFCGAIYPKPLNFIKNNRTPIDFQDACDHQEIQAKIARLRLNTCKEL